MGLKDFSGNNPSGTNNNGNNSNTGGNGFPPSIPLPITPSRPSTSGGDYEATDFLINYNDKFKTAGPALFREAVVEQTLATLISCFKPNPLLIGPAGCGKTKIAEDIAYRIANDDPLLPDQLKGYTVYELPLSNLVAGSSLVGELEAKTKCVIEFATDPKNKAILFIDEIHMILGENQVYDKIAQILKPSLARGEMKVIGATTTQESQVLLKDPAFSRRFQRIIVDELSRSQTLTILKNVATKMIKHYDYKVQVTDDLLEEVTVIADEYHAVGSHRPDTAITLLDRSFGDAVIRRKIAEEKAKNDPVILNALKAAPIITLQKSHIILVAKRLMTGNNQKEKLDVTHLQDQLSEIKGQDEIVSALIDLIKRHDAAIYPHKRPLSLMFSGPSGVGKSEIAKIIAKELTGVKPIILNMTEYNSPAAINRIIGAPAGYVGSDSHSELPFDCLETNPYQVILLDEFEKGDQSVQRLFMNVFEDGNLTTSRGKEINFSKAIIIATTNAACDLNHDGIGFGISDASAAKSKSNLVKDLAKSFDNELLNRFHDIFEFNPLSKDIYREILSNKYTKDITRIKSEHRGVTLPDVLPDSELDSLVAETYIPAFGARPAGRTVQKYIEDKLI